MRHTTIDETVFSLLSWSELAAITEELALEVAASGHEFDRIIAVANGGLTMARHFGDLLGMRKISLLQTAYYAEIGETTRAPELLQPLSVDVSGERLLVFEDIVDTGVTLQFVKNVLTQQYDAKSVHVASLLVKSWAAVQPDFVSQQLDTWVIYPYETRESIETLSKRWQEAGKSHEECWQRLARIGFAPADIDLYCV